MVMAQNFLQNYGTVIAFPAGLAFSAELWYWPRIFCRIEVLFAFLQN
jgi:hypothetical protein